MGFQEQIYSLAYLTERKPFWLFPWTTALQTKPAINSNTDGRYKNCLNVHNIWERLRMKCLNTPAHSCSEWITEGRGEGCPPCTCSPSSSLCPELPEEGTPRQESGQAAVPTHLPGTATPEHHLRSPARAPLPQLLTRREIKVSRGREHRRTPAQHSLTEDTSPPPRAEKAAMYHRR